MRERINPRSPRSFAWAAALILGATALAQAQPAPVEKPIPASIDFNRDVRPILSENCFFCHGFDKNKRKADVRLDTREGLLAAGENGPIVKPGKPMESQLFLRIITDDPDLRMPDPKSHKRLSPHDVALLKKWIEQGADYKGHWAYIKPIRAAAPALDADSQKRVRNPVDAFILAKLKDQALKPSAEADRVTLLRRVTFDLTGLPPTPAEVEAFASDASPDAYEKVVDRLLASPTFGERMAVYWLDLVRYADSIGYHSDNPMNVSPYKDWVIDAFNQNEPFDRFTIEQLAGDLLEHPTLSQKVASAYNRLLQTTEEGGAQAKEYEQKYLADRVRNLSTVWLGQTLGCAQCHDHKFDPIATKDFYSVGAFFADIQEATLGRREAGIPVTSGEQLAAEKKLDETIASLKEKLDHETPSLAAARAEWEQSAGQQQVEWKTLTADPASLASDGEVKLATQSDGSILARGKFPATANYTFTTPTDLKGITAIRLEMLTDASAPANGPGTAPNGNFVLTEFKVSCASGVQPAPGKPVKFKSATADHSQENYPIAHAIDGNDATGWAVLPEIGKSHTAIFEPDKAIGPDGGSHLAFRIEFRSPFPQHEVARFRLSATTAATPTSVMPGNIAAILAAPPDKRSDAQKAELAKYYRGVAPLLVAARDELKALEQKKTELLNGVPKVLVTTAGAPRVVRVLPRGNWQDDSGPVVEPAVPGYLTAAAPFDVKGRRATRLDLARWLVSRDNPLTSRVFVNRAWKMFFGQGICKGLEDLGSQGEWPTHPELLDWLAVEFMDSGWDVKHMVRLLVTSNTYRQTSIPSADQKSADPYNRLYARQSRFRLDAEIVRDNALDVSGLLVKKVGGPVAFPYQPAGYWFALNFPAREWKDDKGEGLYRRTLYTHWQRSFLHPMLLAFDAPSREEGVCERARSNIPQQALVLLNDPEFVEAARAFAERIMTQGGSTVDARIAWAFHHALSRAPRPEETQLLATLYAKHAAEFAHDKEAAKKLVAVGDHVAPPTLDVVDLAAWTSVARTVFNTSEMVTRY